MLRHEFTFLPLGKVSNDYVTLQSCITSKFKDLRLDPSTVHRTVDNTKKRAVTKAINSTTSDETTQRWAIAKNLNGTFQHISEINGKKAQTISNTAVEAVYLRHAET
jgi:hypothetical protein